MHIFTMSQLWMNDGFVWISLKKATFFSNRAGLSWWWYYHHYLKSSVGENVYDLPSRGMANYQKVTEQWKARMPQYIYVSKFLFCFERISKANTLSSNQIRTDWGAKKRTVSIQHYQVTLLSVQFKMPCEHTNRNKQSLTIHPFNSLCVMFWWWCSLLQNHSKAATLEMHDAEVSLWRKYYGQSRLFAKSDGISTKRLQCCQ